MAQMGMSSDVNSLVHAEADDACTDVGLYVVSLCEKVQTLTDCICSGGSLKGSTSRDRCRTAGMSDRVYRFCRGCVRWYGVFRHPSIRKKWGFCLSLSPPLVPLLCVCVDFLGFRMISTTCRFPLGYPFALPYLTSLSFLSLSLRFLRADLWAPRVVWVRL